MKLFLKSVAAVACAGFVLPASAIFTNGGFEAGNLSGWTTGGGINSGLTGAGPTFTGANINITGTAAFRGAVVTTGATDLVGAPITLPYAGSFTARVNNIDTGGIANFLRQADTITNADRDATDNRLHVRFAYAVVLNNPGHTASGQPFFYLRVRNVTKGTTLYEDFSFAGQTGTQFLNVPTNTSYQYLNWKPADVIVPDADLGDSIEVYLLASDCQPSAHPGYAYLDGFGSAVVAPGVTPPALREVPTLSESMLIALGSLMLAAAAFARRHG